MKRSPDDGGAGRRSRSRLAGPRRRQRPRLQICRSSKGRPVSGRSRRRPTRSPTGGQGLLASAANSAGPSRKTGTYTARILVGTAVRHRPGGKAVKWYARTRTKWSGNGQSLMVLKSRQVRGKTWLKVRLPIRPNGSSGWIPRDRVQIRRSPDTSSSTGQAAGSSCTAAAAWSARFRVVIGAPGTPTPLGLFALQDRVRQPDRRGFIGPWAIPLTAHSEALRRYDGGPGLVALHGRSGASLRDPLGSARSHGCVRMNNGRIARLKVSLLGTAVRIRN